MSPGRASPSYTQTPVGPPAPLTSQVGITPGSSACQWAAWTSCPGRMSARQVREPSAEKYP